MSYAAACLAALLAAVVSAWGRFLVRGSTAGPAAAWAVAGCLALAAEMAARATGMLASPAPAASARLVVAALSLCPTMSLLGAKRPQHGVWQSIVATLAVVLALPAVTAVLVRPGSLPDVHLLERCLMPLLVTVGWMNFVGTGRAVAATIAACGQLLLLAGFLPGANTEAWTDQASLDTAAAGLILAATLLAACQAAIAGRRPKPDPLHRQPTRAAALVDPAFRSLRETFGAVWTLRIMERFDAVAAERGWPCRLRFHGLDCPASAPQESSRPPWERDATRVFRGLALRFVNDAWLARHGWQPGAVVDETQPQPAG